MKTQIIAIAMLWLCYGITNAQKTSDLNVYRGYDEVSWVITHNAYQNPEINATDAGIGGKNQDHSINTQLNNGVRSFMIDLQYGGVSNWFKGEFLHLGHGVAGYFNWMEMCDFLEDIKQFLDANRNEVITLHMEIDASVTVDHINDAFNGRGNRCNSRADIDHYLYTQPERNKKWPSLATMINDNKRLVVLSEKDFGGGAPSWLHYEFAYTRQNDFDANQVSELTQTHRYEIDGNPGRGDNRSSLLTINNFAVDSPLGYGDGNKAADANGYGKMYDKLIDSWFSYAMRPSMAVDFYEKNNYSALSVATTANNLNEVRGRFKFADGNNFEDYVETNTSFNGENPWYIQGAKTKARLHYSFPARPGEDRVITFWHPDYAFSPSEISLGSYNGSIKNTYIIDVVVTPKNKIAPIDDKLVISSDVDEVVLYKKEKDMYVLDLRYEAVTSINLMVYDATGKLIENITRSKGQYTNQVEFNLPQSGLYIIQGYINGIPYINKMIN